MMFLATTTTSSRRQRGVNTATLGCCLMCFCLIFERSAAFLFGGAPAGFAGRTAVTLSSTSPSSSFVSRGAIRGFQRLAGAGSCKRRGQHVRQAVGLSMEITMNPITSKQYGKSSGKKAPDVNEEITVETVRCVISVKGMDEQLGVMPTSEALGRAQAEGLDLVMISPDADPPVVKIIDYGKFKYKSDKKRKDGKAKAKSAEMKEVKMSYKIEQHDYEVRLRNAKKFVGQGHRVRVIVQFRGREQAHMDLGSVLLDKVVKDMEGHANAEPKRREGSRLSMILSPKTAQL